MSFPDFPDMFYPRNPRIPRIPGVGPDANATEENKVLDKRLHLIELDIKIINKNIELVMEELKKINQKMSDLFDFQIGKKNFESNTQGL